MQAHARACVRDVPCVTAADAARQQRGGARRARARGGRNLGGEEGVSYLWTTGACTAEPELHCGRRAVRGGAGARGRRGEEAVEFAHVCRPARVEVRPREEGEEEQAASEKITVQR